jgi:anti-anti-sigma regulatory factor
MLSIDSPIRPKWEDEYMVISFIDRNILDMRVIKQALDDISIVVADKPNLKLIINLQGIDHLSGGLYTELRDLQRTLHSKSVKMVIVDNEEKMLATFAGIAHDSTLVIVDNMNEAKQRLAAGVTRVVG